eukprot:g16299.t1
MVQAGGAGVPADAMQVRGGAAGFATSIDGAGKSTGASTNGEGTGEAATQKRGLPGLWQRYLDSLDRRPLITKALSTGVIDGTANMIEQTLSPHPFSWVGWIAFTLVGGVFIGPALHFWYNVLERVNHSKLLTSRVPSKWGRVLVQVALDQSFGASIMNCSYFTMHTVILAALTGNLFPLPELVSAVVDKVSSRYVTMIINNAKLWPGVGLLNFGLVPKNLRVLVTNFVAVFWGYLMSKWVK